MVSMHTLPRLRAVRRQQYLVTKCTAKRTLHLGAVDYHKGIFCGLHKALIEVAECVIGIDIDWKGIEHARSEGIQNIHYGDLERLHELNISGKFDVIVAGEVIEHLSNPGLFLAGIKRFFGPDSEMVLTTPNAFSFHRFLLALGGLEYVHPDHVCYYSYTTLKHLLESHGFVIKEELNYVLEGKFANLRTLLSRINFHFANGLIFVVKI